MMIIYSFNLVGHLIDRLFIVKLLFLWVYRLFENFDMEGLTLQIINSIIFNFITLW